MQDAPRALSGRSFVVTGGALGIGGGIASAAAAAGAKVLVVDLDADAGAARINEITSGEGVDVSLDCTAGAGTIPVLLGIEALKRKGGTLLIQGEDVPEFPNFPLGKIGNKYITVKAARGHNFESCELALKQLNSDRFELDSITTHRFGLKDTHDAIYAVGGSGDVIHVSLMPWK